MKNKNIVISIISFFFLLAFAQAPSDKEVVERLTKASLVNNQAYETLRYLCKNIGPRLSGSAGERAAITYMEAQMRNYYGFDTVYLQPVMVPHWERGLPEEAAIIEGKKRIAVSVVALGNSAASPKGGINAPIIQCNSLAELTAKAHEVKGKIVFFNRPMNEEHFHTFEAYGNAVDQRSRGPALASKYGAVGVVVRSMSLRIDEHPHTGNTHFGDEQPIPAVAIATKHADFLNKRLTEGEDVFFYMKTNCIKHTDKPSFNVIGEMFGYQHPERIIVVGGHLDAWDNGEGAHDDGAGCVQSMQVVNLFRILKIRPKNTIRVVLFANEENGLRGAIAYSEKVISKQEPHIAAIESDAGGFTPRWFSVDATDDKVADLQFFVPALKQTGIGWIERGGSGADIGPLKPTGALLIGFRPDSQRYFDLHHASTDVFEQIHPRELALGASAMAGLVYLIDKYY